MNKKKVLFLSGFINIVILIVILINIIIVFPLTAESTWIYGTYIMIAGFVTYFTGLFLVEGYRLETIGTILVLIGEIFIISYFAIAIGNLWVSVFVVFPVITFCVMIIVAYYYSKEMLPNQNAYNLSLMLISGAFFFLMVEAAIRVPEFFQTANVPIWAIIIMAAGLIIYAFTTWKIFKKPSYIMALSGAFIVNIGLLMLELFYRMHELGIFTLIFLPPAVVFFLLIYLNYKISPT